MLSDPNKRVIYDQVGEEGLKGGGGGGGSGSSGGFSGFPGGAGRGGGGVHFNDPNDIFRMFFGGEDPLSGDDHGGMGGMGGMRGMGGMPGMQFGGGGVQFGGGGMPRPRAQAAAPTQKAPPINHALNCSLEDLYNGIFTFL